jgi:hypothetical protein
MTGEPRQPLEPYERVTHPAFAESAKKFTASVITKGALLLHGPCPRCGSPISVPVIEQIFRQRPARRVRIRDVTVTCNCAEAHPNRPDGFRGCGAYWNFTLEETIEDEPANDQDQPGP